MKNTYSCAEVKSNHEEDVKIEAIKMKQKEEENKKKQGKIKKVGQIYNLLDPLQKEEIKIETKNRLPDFWKMQLNKERFKRKASKMLETTLRFRRQLMGKSLACIMQNIKI